MNFAKQIMDAQGHGQYERIDTSLLPNLYIGYKTQLSKVSGVVLNDLATRYKNNDPLTLQTLARLHRWPRRKDRAAQARLCHAQPAD